MPKILLQLMLFFCLTAGSIPVAIADYYKYTDASGVVHITNTLESVPQKYRSKVKVISDAALSKQDAGARKEQPPESGQEETRQPNPALAPAPATAPQGKIAELSARFVWFKPLLYLAAILAAFLVVIKLASVVPSAQLAKLIYLCFFIGVFVVLYKAYVEHVVADSMAVKEKAVTMIKKSSIREIPLPDEAPPAANK